MICLKVTFAKPVFFVTWLEHRNPLTLHWLEETVSDTSKKLHENIAVASGHGTPDTERSTHRRFQPSRQKISRHWSVVSCVRCVRCGCWVLGLDSRSGHLRCSSQTSDWYRLICETHRVIFNVCNSTCFWITLISFNLWNQCNYFVMLAIPHIFEYFEILKSKVLICQ